jgi:hypothetical protein
VLPGRWRDLLRDGNQGDYATDHAAVMAVALVMVRHGWGWSDFYAEMTDPNNALSGYYRRRDDGGRRTPAAATRKMHREWYKAIAYAAEHPRVMDAGEARQFIGVLRECMSRYPWTGRSAGRNRQILTILLDQATKHGTISPSLSLRVIAERSSYRSLEAISNGLNALAGMGWIVSDRRGCSADEPTVYRLGLPTPHPHSAAVSANPNNRLSSSPGDDDVRVSVTAHTGLAIAFTMHAATIYACLGDDAQPASAVMGRAGCSRDTVDRWLRRLEKVDLARRTVDGWRKGTADPDQIAAAFGANEVVAERRTRHELQRRGFHGARGRQGGRVLTVREMRPGRSRGGWPFAVRDGRRTRAWRTRSGPRRDVA